jgi:hypothetical protein
MYMSVIGEEGAAYCVTAIYRTNTIGRFDIPDFQGALNSSQPILIWNTSNRTIPFEADAKRRSSELRQSVRTSVL